MTVAAIVKAGWPKASGQLVDYILWSRTAYPFVGPTAKMIYRAANGAYRAHKKGMQLCDFCERPAVIHSECQRCHDALNKGETK